MEQNCIQGMELNIRDYTIIKVAPATHHQDDIIYGASRGIKYSCMSLVGHSLNILVYEITLI